MPLPTTCTADAGAEHYRESKAKARNEARNTAYLNAIFTPQKMPYGALILDPADWWVPGAPDLFCAMRDINLALIDGDSIEQMRDCLDRLQRGLDALRKHELGEGA